MGDFNLVVDASRCPIVAKALRQLPQAELAPAMAKCFYKIGKYDIDKLKSEGLSGLKIRSKGFANQFKSKASDSRVVKSLDKIQLSEHTGARPFRIFELGGDIQPSQSKTLTILTPDARKANGRRKYTQKQLKAMVQSGEAAIIQTKRGPAIIKTTGVGKGGKLRKGAKTVVLAFLRRSVHEIKRIDFFGNFEKNKAAHDHIFNAELDKAIKHFAKG